MTDLVLVMGFVGLVVALFVLAMAEASLLNVRASEVAAKAAAGERGSRRLADLLDDLPSVMNSVLLVVLLGQVTATSIAGVLAERWFGGAGVTAATAVVTITLFVYGEAIPKTIALRNPSRLALRLAGLIGVIRSTLDPVVTVLVWIADRQSPGSGAASADQITERELLHIADEAAAAGEIDTSDAELIRRSFSLGDRQVGELMVPIARVVAVASTTPIDQALETAFDNGHRRILVHSDTAQRFSGFVRLRDLAQTARAGGEATVSSCLVDVPVVRESDLAIDVLRSMQRDHRPVSVVTGADSVVVGMVTIEDIVRELLGDIAEPHPDPPSR